MKNLRISLLLGVLAVGACATAPAAQNRPPAASSKPAASTSAVIGFGFTVSDLEAATQFFVKVLDAEEVRRDRASGPELAALTGLNGPSAEAAHLRVGTEFVTLTRYDGPAGEPAPAGGSNDAVFQHLALVVRDMDGAYDRVRAADVNPISKAGPERIPDSNPVAAGIRAFYFLDADRHPLELIWFPKGKGASRWQVEPRGPLVLGIDHSAIAVASTETSLRFYRDGLGLVVAGESLNFGIEQERLSGVDGAKVRITGLRGREGPGVEFLQYVEPGPGRARPASATPRDLFHWETVIAVTDLRGALERVRGAGGRVLSADVARCELCLVGTHAALIADPDGHVIRLVETRK